MNEDVLANSIIKEFERRDIPYSLGMAALLKAFVSQCVLNKMSDKDFEGSLEFLREIFKKSAAYRKG